MTLARDIASPASLNELSHLVSSYDGRILFVCGATDFIIDLKIGHLSKPDLAIDISRLPELSYIATDTDCLRIGAATSFSRILENAMVGRHFNCLIKAVEAIGSVQIRNRGTIGGNIATASPCGDTLPVLWCLDAEVSILGKKGQLTKLPIDEVITGERQTCLGNGDLITEIGIPKPDNGNTLSAFQKLGRRGVMTISKLNLCAVVKYDGNSNRIDAARVAAGSIGGIPLRLTAAERILERRHVDGALFREFVDHLPTVVDEAIPGRVSRLYKRHAIRGLGEDIMNDLFAGKIGLEREGAVPP